jgi:hypothetical protein
MVIPGFAVCSNVPAGGTSFPLFALRRTSRYLRARTSERGQVCECVEKRSRSCKVACFAVFTEAASSRQPEQ